MIDSENFKNEKGSIDWNAYSEAQKKNGEICDTCGDYIFSFMKKKQYRQDCAECENIKNNEIEPIRHSKYIRCPNCGDFYDPSECDEYEVFGDGEHSLQCQECNYEFEIVTNVSYSFESPERLKNAS